MNSYDSPVYQLARFLSREPADLEVIRRAWPDAPIQAGADSVPMQVWLKAHPDLAREVLSVDPNAKPAPPSPPPLHAADVPELPEDARLEIDFGNVGVWLDEYLDYATKKSPSTPELFHEAAALFAGGLAIARRLRVPMAHADIWPNLYVLLVAPTTLYAKSVGLRILTDLVDEAMPHLRLSCEFTPEALLADLGGQEPTGLGEETDEIRNLWLSSRNFAAQRGIILDEASALFAGFKRDYMTGTSEMLMRLYDAPGRYTRNTRGGGLVVVRFPMLSFLGATTPASLRRADVSAAWHNGLFARFALLTPDCEPVYAQSDTHPQAPPKLTATLRRLASELLPEPVYPNPPEVYSVSISSDAHAAWRRYDKALRFDLLTSSDHPDPRLWGCYGRLPTQALKAAMILAALDWASRKTPQPCITLDRWARAQMIAEKWRASAHRLLDLLTGEEEAGEEERVIRLLGRSKEAGMTAREISQLAHRSRAQIEPLLERLVDDGLVDRFKPEGAKATRYRLVRSKVSVA